MYAAVVILLMFGAVIMMVKKTDKDVTTTRTSDFSIRVRPKPHRRTGRVAKGNFIRLKLIKR
jgi:hypothetical protein